jgi:CheY-like chemotaxis protein
MKDLRIIAADDDEITLFILLKNITDGGHSGVGFGEGVLTWEHLEAYPHEVDLVILDKMMAAISGLEIIRRMKGHPVLKNIPVIIQSGDAVSEKIREAMDMGADGYITKPYNQRQLLELIDEVMGRHSRN